jgi:peptidoglycan-associated lipoprotein
MRVQDFTAGRRRATSWRRALGVSLAVGAAGCANSNAPLKPMAARGPACADVVFPIYFAEGSDALTSVAQQVIVSSVGQVRGCRIGYVNVLGLTDSAGPAAQNLELSKRRADAVAKALSAAGLQTPKFEVEGAGENGAVTDSGAPVPLRRKTEVIIHPLPA